MQKMPAVTLAFFIGLNAPLHFIRYIATMQPHILTIPDDTVYTQLIQLATAVGLHITPAG